MNTEHPIGVEVGQYEEPGYKPVIRSAGDWMAALLNGSDESWSVPEKLEMHPETDELFALMSGKAHLVTGGCGETPGIVEVTPMEAGVLYNVKAGTWHWTPMTRDATFVIVEKTGTNTDGTTRYETLSKEQREGIVL